MNLSVEAKAAMRVRMPSSAHIRNSIAAHAAESSGREPSYYLDKLGDIKAVEPAHQAYGTAWRLDSYHGSAEDADVIEQAAAKVYRTFPFMEAD